MSTNLAKAISDLRAYLLPCPSCGGPAEESLHDRRGWIGCTACDLGVPYNVPHRADSVEVWNRRTDPPSPGGTCTKCGRTIYSNESSIHKTNGTDEHLYACPKGKP